MLRVSSILLATSLVLNAVTITAQGYANNEKDSQKEALSSLSGQISVDVKSDYQTYTSVVGGDYQKNKQKLIQLSSSLPIKGASFNSQLQDDIILTTATLSSQTALKIYEFELERLSKNISFNQDILNSTHDNSIKYNTYKDLLKDVENFNKHKIVATMLKGKNLPSINITISNIKQNLQALENKVPSIDLASKLLTKGIKQKSIYLSAIKSTGSTQVTQFAKVLKDTMSNSLKTVQKSSNAKYFLRGNYEILKDSIFVTINLSDRNNEIVLTKTVTLSPSAYEHTKYKPTTVSFDEALNTGFVKSGKFTVDIGFRGYSRSNGIDLVEGDSVDFVVKTNKPMCYFLVGHVLDDQFSYVLPIGSDNSPFINKITGSDVNQNIVIYEDAIMEAPFGSENLQIFASTLGKNGSCSLQVPQCEENQDGYCVIKGKPSQVVKNTRGFSLKKKKKVKIEKAENSISYTSFPKTTKDESEKLATRGIDLQSTDSQASAKEFMTIDVMYGTNRATTGYKEPNKYFGKSLSSKLNWGVCKVSLPITHKVGEIERPSWFKFEFKEDPRKHVMIQTLTEMTKTSFNDYMKESFTSMGKKDVLIFIHGFSNKFDESVRKAGQIAYDLDFPGIAMTYSWPSQGAFSLTNYKKDEKYSAYSVKYLKEFLLNVVEMAKGHKINIIAHSMGNRVLLNAVGDIQKSAKGTIFNQIILAAPDVNAKVFKEEIMPKMLGKANKITLYASSEDRALQASRHLHQQSRLGESGEFLTVVEGMDTIDSTGVDPSTLGHSYFSSTRTLLLDMKNLMLKNTPPSNRNLKTIEEERISYWEMIFDKILGK
jgi:esterase/lipase superfamily enzyme